MPDQANGTEKQAKQDSALIELLIALANRGSSVSRGRSRLSRPPQRDGKANEAPPEPQRERTALSPRGPVLDAPDWLFVGRRSLRSRLTVDVVAPKPH